MVFEMMGFPNGDAIRPNGVNIYIDDLKKTQSNTIQEVYDYIFIDSGSPESYLTRDSTTFINESLALNATFNNTIESISNDTRSRIDEDVSDLIIMTVISIVLGLMILITVIGNVFVIAAIILERNLQNVANYLVASLAVADLFVACLVMPLGAVYEISRGWILGPELCDIWTSCDVLCCTASILHLVAIAMDRYWAVTNIDYIHNRTSRRVFMMIFLVWFAAVIVSLAPQFGWKDPDYLQRIEQQKCMVSQDVGYQVFATCCTFYVPLLVILLLYWQIYQTARKRIHRRRPKPVENIINKQTIPPKTKSRLRFKLTSKFSNPVGRTAISSLGLVEGNSTNTINTVEDVEDSGDHRKANISVAGESISGGGLGGGTEITTTFNDQEITTTNQIATVSHQVTINQADEITNNDVKSPTTVYSSCNNSPTSKTNPNQISTASSHQHNHPSTPTTTTTSTQHQNSQALALKKKETLEAKRERKAAKTLAIITGAFVICWLPFFLMALLLPLCGEQCEMNDSIASLFLWLGYFNSTLNPVIYTIFSPEFRQAFKRILFGAHRSSSYYRGSRF